MRYLTVCYYRRNTGAMDEVVGMTRRLKARDIDTASVILDFATRSVLKANLQGQAATRDWSTIVDYYRRHYDQVIERLEHENQS